jgi:hypothetical protein
MAPNDIAPRPSPKNEGILEANIEGVRAGHKTIFQQPEDSSSGEIDAVVIDDYGANRYATIAEPPPKENQHEENNE